MDEKIIIRSKPLATLKTLLVFILIGIALGILLGVTCSFAEYTARLDEAEPVFRKYETDLQFYKEASKKAERGEALSSSETNALEFDTAKEYALSECFHSYDRQMIREYHSAEDYAWANLILYIGLGAGLAIILSIAGLIYYLTLRHRHITVTDKRVFAHLGWCRDISIPLYAVRSASTLPWKGIVAGSSSAKIILFWVPNYKAIYQALNVLLLNTSAAISTASAAIDASAPTVAPATVPAAPSAAVPAPVPASSSAIRTSLPPEAPGTLPPQIAMQAAAHAAASAAATASKAPELPTPGSSRTTPTAPAATPATVTGGTQIGKCTLCGKTNVPVTTVSVNVAGRVRVRHFCDECNAKR